MNRAGWHKVFEKWLSRGELAQLKDLPGKEDDPSVLIIPDDLMETIKKKMSGDEIIFYTPIGAGVIQVVVPVNAPYYYLIDGRFIISTEETLILIGPGRRWKESGCIEPVKVEFVPWGNITSIRLFI